MLGLRQQVGGNERGIRALTAFALKHGKPALDRWNARIKQWKEGAAPAQEPALPDLAPLARRMAERPGVQRAMAREKTPPFPA